MNLSILFGIFHDLVEFWVEKMSEIRKMVSDLNVENIWFKANKTRFWGYWSKLVVTNVNINYDSVGGSTFNTLISFGIDGSRECYKQHKPSWFCSSMPCARIVVKHSQHVRWVVCVCLDHRWPNRQSSPEQSLHLHLAGGDCVDCWDLDHRWVFGMLKYNVRNRIGFHISIAKSVVDHCSTGEHCSS